MSRTGLTKPESDPRLSDHLSWAMLLRVFPPDTVDQAIADAGKVEQRTRLLPAQLVAYYVMGLALFSQSSYEEVMEMLLHGRSWAAGQAPSGPVPTKAALSKARARLGAEPLELLFARVAVPMAEPTGPVDDVEVDAAFYRSWRLMSFDRACLDVPDTAANDAGFGRPEDESTRPHPLPQVQVVGLTETGTRTIVEAALGSVHEPRQALAARLLPALSAGALVLAGPLLFTPDIWAAAAATGADLLWGLHPEVPVTLDERHADGSSTGRIDTGDGVPLPVRVIEWPGPTADHTAGPTADHAEGLAPLRLATTIVDPALAPASDLTAIYGQRGTIQSAFDELRAHHQLPRVVLRSKTPDGVRQEVYGYLCVHYAIRHLLYGVPWPGDRSGAAPHGSVNP